MMISQSQHLHVLIIAFLGVLLLIGALVSIAYLAGASTQDLRLISRTNRNARPLDGKLPVASTVRHLLGFGLLASGPLLVGSALFAVAVWRPPYWYGWLIGAVVLAGGLIWLSTVVGPPVAMEKPTGKHPLPPRPRLRELAGGLIGATALLAAASNVGALLVTGAPLFPPHPLNPVFPLALILLFSAASRLIRGPR
jgi:hypothetical protein